MKNNNADKKKVIKYYLLMKQYESSNETPQDFCEKRNIDLRQMQNMKNIIRGGESQNPIKYKHLVELNDEFEKKTHGLRLAEFCKLHNIKATAFFHIRTHLRYKKIIADYLQKQEEFEISEKENEIMDFKEVISGIPMQTEVKNPDPYHPTNRPALSHDVINSQYAPPQGGTPSVQLSIQNTIEISIKKGVKVILDENCDNNITIKIINFLKGL
jgi:hypothetical protein